MKHGFLKVGAATPEGKVADSSYNRVEICRWIAEAEQRQIKILVFPELCITSYTCEDLFFQEILLKEAIAELEAIRVFTNGLSVLTFVGLPFSYKGKLYNTAAVIQNGRILGMIPKTNIPNYSEFYEARHFTPAFEKNSHVIVGNEQVPFGTNVLFQCSNMPELVVGAEICEDLWVADSPSIRHAAAGATVIANLSASDETAGKMKYRRQLISGQSAKLVCGYIYADAGEGESTTDLVFGGHNLIAENGEILTESKRFASGMISADLDIGRIISERRRLTASHIEDDERYITVSFVMKENDTHLERSFPTYPFVPQEEEDRKRRCEEILEIQSRGLKKRLSHTGVKKAVIGISGGLDSTLAMLVTVKAFDILKLPRENIIAVTMPCFGTTDRTYNNAVELSQNLHATLMEINIKEAVIKHFEKIGHDRNQYDVTYENAQARERTQILMDLSNKLGGMVIGTGDMSELALGWATYNGDHMSMYGVNGSVPKTLVRHLVQHYLETCNEHKLTGILMDVLDTPVSPELLPPTDGMISQKTEDIVGPYELHDFFLYYILRFGYEPSKVFRIAKQTFARIYEPNIILKWLQIFYRRFFSQQYKRSCLPDGPKVGSVALSPRGDLRMPSDASAAIWIKAVENLK